MWTKRLLLSIFLLGLISGAKFQSYDDDDDDDISVPSKETRISYTMIVSVNQQSGKTGQVCVFIDSEESVRLEVTFEYKDEKISILDEEVSSECFKCGSFSVPIVESAQLAYVTFSAVGATVDKRERKTVVITTTREGCFTQMEKTLYSAGEIVRCRVFCLNSDLKPTKQQFLRVFLVEPNGARVAQTSEPLSKHDVTSVEFSLNKDAGSGSYHLLFERISGDPVYSYFTVENYDLPRFDSTVSCLNQISVLDKSAPVKVSAKYVYGKPLPATVIGKCCRNVRYTYGRARNCMRGLENICLDFTGELDSDGVYTELLDLDLFKLQFSAYDDSIQCEVTVKEAGTDVLDTKSCYIYITNRPANLQLDYNYYNQYYKNGLDYPFAAKLTNEKGEPMPGERIIIEIDGHVVKKVITDAQGRVECAIDTTLYHKPNITISACYPNEDQCYATNQDSWMYNRFYPGYPYHPNPEYPCAVATAYRFVSESYSFIQMRKIQGPLSCNVEHFIEVEYKITEAGVGRDATSVTFYHMVKTRDGFTFHSEKTVDLIDGWKGSYKLPLLEIHELAPSTQLLIMAVMEPEIISDSMYLDVESCFKNQVTMTFTESIVAPGSTVEREISAAPGSICGLKASDVSLDLLGSYDALSPDHIYSILNNYQYAYSVESFDLEEPAPPCEDPNTEVFCNGGFYRIVSSPTDGTSYDNFRSCSLIVASSLLVRKPQVCGMENDYNYNYGGDPVYTLGAETKFAADRAPPGGSSFETVRDNFENRFGWDCVLTGSDGIGSVTSIIPDQITEWKSSAFCLSETHGVGLTNESPRITTFLPLFVEVTTARFCTKGEKSIITVSAANYLEKCVKVKLEIQASDDYTVAPYDDEDDEICICANGRASKQWVVEFNNIGDISITASASTIPTQVSDSCHDQNDDNEEYRKDTVIIVVNVEPNGIKHEGAFSYLHQVKDSTADSVATIEYPDNLVKDSYELHVTVVGDPIQLGVENLNQLLNLPDGCCEQNLVRILCTIYMYNYLKDTGRLNPELEEKVKNNLINAYGRQLPCRNWEGQYSVFRNSFIPNSWVTVNTFYAFEMMKGPIYVDTDIQQKTLSQVGNHQDIKTGCFSPTGSFFTNQDENENEILFTAYLVQRFMKCNLYGIGDALLEGGLRCLRNADLQSLNTYTLSYVAYAAALAGLDILDTVLNILKPLAKTEDGLIHWEQENLPSGKPYFYSCPSSDVDMTSNILLGFLKNYRKSEETDAFLSEIAAWLAFCQNSRGGSSSSQDTIVATEALTEYGRLFFVGESDALVVVNQGSEEVARIVVDESNKLLVQRVKLVVVEGDYYISTSGTGNPLVQINFNFNTEATNAESSLVLTVTTQKETCIEDIARVIHVHICVGYYGSRKKTNMILIDIKELSGYSSDRRMVRDLVSNEKINEYEFEDNHVHFYLESITAGTDVCFTVTMYMENRVLSYSSGTVMAQDYYHRVDVNSAQYYHPCSPLLEEQS